MHRYDNRARALAVWLSGVAGYVDAVGFLKLGGFFVSFMSGNSTRMAVAVTRGDRGALLGLGLIACFVAGVALGSLCGHLAAAPRRRQAILIFVTALLSIAAAAGAAGLSPLAVPAMVLAMGAENAVFESDGDVQIGLTYMTGALAKIGQRLAAAAFGGDRLAWLPYAFLWLGLVAGAIAGAAAYAWLGMSALWIAAGATALAAAAASRLENGTIG